jgi:hypothetical protein
MIALVLALEVLTAMPTATFTACWMPAAGVQRYELREAAYDAREWTPYRYNVACVANTLCCVDGLAWHDPRDGANRWWDYRSWILLGYDNASSAGDRVAQSGVLFVDYNQLGRRTSATPVATLSAPTLMGVTL